MINKRKEVEGSQLKLMEPTMKQECYLHTAILNSGHPEWEEFNPQLDRRKPSFKRLNNILDKI